MKREQNQTIADLLTATRGHQVQWERVGTRRYRLRATVQFPRNAVLVSASPWWGDGRGPSIRFSGDQTITPNKHSTQASMLTEIAKVAETAIQRREKLAEIEPRENEATHDR